MLIRSLFLFLATTTLISCTSDLKILSASARYLSSEKVELTVRTSSAAASRIKNGQYYFSIVLYDCLMTNEGFPVEPYVGLERATKFTFPTKGQYVQFTGIVPKEIFNEYHEPCVHLRGGGYLTGRIKSNSVAVTGR